MVWWNQSLMDIWDVHTTPHARSINQVHNYIHHSNSKNESNFRAILIPRESYVKTKSYVQILNDSFNTDTHLKTVILKTITWMNCFSCAPLFWCPSKLNTLSGNSITILKCKQNKNKIFYPLLIPFTACLINSRTEPDFLLPPQKNYEQYNHSIQSSKIRMLQSQSGKDPEARQM